MSTSSRPLSSIPLKTGWEDSRSWQSRPWTRSCAPRGMRRRARRELVKLVGGETTNLILAQAEATYGTTAALAPKARPGARHLLLMSSYAIASTKQ